MPKTISYEGGTYEFPDDVSDEEILGFLGKNVRGPTQGERLQQQRDSEILKARVARDAAPPAPTGPAPTDLTAAGATNAIVRGGSPYVAAGLAGLAAGGPYGAGAALGGMALTDAASFAWNNTGANWFNAPKMMGGADAFRAVTDMTGLTQPLSGNPTEQSLYNIADMTAGSVGAGKAVNVAGEVLSKVPGFRRVGNFLKTPVGVAPTMTGAAGGAITQEALINSGVSPEIAALVSIPAAVATGSLGSVGRVKPLTPALTGAEWKGKVNAAYEAAQQQGVLWSRENIDSIATRAVNDAISPAHPGGPMSSASVSTEITDLLDKMRTQAASSSPGTLNAQDIETYRQKLSDIVRRLPNIGGEQKTGQRILEQFDALTNNSANTLNAARGSLFANLTARQQADAAAKAAAGTPQQAAADAAADTARVNFEAAQKNLRRQDPELIPLAQKSQRADEVVARATQIDKDATDAYNLANNAPNLAALEKAKDAAQAAHDDAAKRFANRPDFKFQMSQYINRLQAATDAEDIAKASVAKTRTAADAAAARLRKAQAEAIVAEDNLIARETSLTKNENAAQRMDARVSLQNEGRSMFPDQLRTQAFEAMPAAAQSAARGSFDTAQQLRRQVADFIRQNDGLDFAGLPAETRREIQKFVAGGSATQKVLDFFGHLAPGANTRNLAGNLLNTMSIFSGMSQGNAFLPLATLGTGITARVAGNATAASQFERLRDMVSRGQAIPYRQPGLLGNQAVNYMFNQQTPGGQ